MGARYRSTLTFIVAFFPSTVVAVILQVPFPLATTFPDFDTTATLRLELLHVTFLVAALVGLTFAASLTARPGLESLTTALRLSFFLPLYSVTDFALTGLPTWMSTEAVLPLAALAVMRAKPVRFARTLPDLETTATRLSEEDHFTGRLAFKRTVLPRFLSLTVP